MEEYDWKNDHRCELGVHVVIRDVPAMFGVVPYFVYYKGCKELFQEVFDRSNPLHRAMIAERA